MYNLRILKAAAKDLKKLSRQAAGEIVNIHLPAIASDPHQGIRLHGELRDYFKHVVHIQGVSYRIAYLMNEQERVVLIVAIGARENFYDRLLRRLA